MKRLPRGILCAVRSTLFEVHRTRKAFVSTLMNERKIKWIAAVAAMVLLSGCAGSRSTIKQGYAFKMSEASASRVVRGATSAHILGRRITFPTELTASGYIRHMLDTHKFNVSAIPVPAKDAFGFEVRHSGTILVGPMKADAIFQSLVERAGLEGPRVSVP